MRIRAPAREGSLAGRTGWREGPLAGRTGAPSRAPASEGPVAARVQDLTRSYEADIILTEALREDLDPRFQLRALPETEVKGVSEPLVIHAVQGFESSGPTGLS